MQVVPIDEVLSEQASSKLASAKVRSAQRQFQALMFLNDSEHLDAHVIEALYDLLLKKSANNILKVEDVIMLVKSDIEIKEYIKKYSQTQLYQLRSPAFVRKHIVKAKAVNDCSYVFNCGSTRPIAKGSEIVSKENWAHLVADMIERDDIYLIERGWSTKICYWGKVAPTSLEPQTEFSYNEWWADFLYYECNTNQFLSIFFHDKHNALKSRYRILIEWVCISLTLTITAASADDEVAGTIISSIIVLFFRNLMLYSFLCPCLITRHDASCIASCCKPVFMKLSGFVAYICVLIAILFTIIGIIAGIGAGAPFLKSFLTSLFSGYICGILLDSFFPFNPFVAAREFREGKFKKYKWCCLYCFYYLLAFVCKQLDLARWQLERKSVNEYFANRICSVPSSEPDDGFGLNTAEEGNASSSGATNLARDAASEKLNIAIASNATTGTVDIAKDATSGTASGASNLVQKDANSDANNSGSMEQSYVPQSLNASIV